MTGEASLEVKRRDNQKGKNHARKKNQAPKTKFKSRCEECLHWDYRHVLYLDGTVSCDSCGVCYHKNEKAIFLTRKQYVVRHSGAVMCHESNW